MLKKFTTKQLVFIALMAAFLFVINFGIGGWIIAITGIPSGSIFLTGITNLVAVTLIALTVRKFGSISLMYLVYSIIALPTPMAGGPPGYVWKILLNVIAALGGEAVIYHFNYQKKGFIIGLPVLTVFMLAIYLAAFRTLGMPEYDKMLSAVYFMGAAFIVLGYLGMWLGFMVYNRFKDKSIVKQLSD